MSLVQVGLFAGGVALGATGAVLLRPNVPSQTQVAQHGNKTVVPGQPTTLQSQLIDSGYTSADDQLIGPGGNPGPISDFLRHAAYISSYDRKLRHPSWTAEHMTAASLTRPDGGRPDRKNSVFREDERIPALFRARMADYFRSGYGEDHDWGDSGATAELDFIIRP